MLHAAPILGRHAFSITLALSLFCVRCFEFPSTGTDIGFRGVKVLVGAQHNPGPFKLLDRDGAELRSAKELNFRGNFTLIGELAEQSQVLAMATTLKNAGHTAAAAKMGHLLLTRCRCPDAVGVRHLLAAVLQEQEAQTSKVQQAFEWALKCNPRHPASLVDLGSVLFNQVIFSLYLRCGSNHSLAQDMPDVPRAAQLFDAALAHAIQGSVPHVLALYMKAKVHGRQHEYHKVVSFVAPDLH